MNRFIILLYKLPRENESQIAACISHDEIISVNTKHDLYRKNQGRNVNTDRGQ